MYADSMNSPGSGPKDKSWLTYFGPYTLPTCLMVILISLAATDLYKQFFIQSTTYWYKEYQDAVLSGTAYWNIGWRLESLELKLDAQTSRLGDVRHSLNNLLPRMKIDMENLRGNMHDFKHTRAARIAMHELLTNDTEIFRIRCGGKDGNLLRVGLNDFRTDERDSCMVFTDTKEPPLLDSTNNGARKERYSPDRILPHSFFEKVPLDEGAFALRPIAANGNYLQAVPSSKSGEGYYSDPWKVVVGGPLVGQQERFRQLPTGEIYSVAMDGYLQCSPSQHIKGNPGDNFGSSKFLLEKVREKDVRYAQEVVSLSEQIIAIQASYTKEHQVSTQARQAAVKTVTGSGDNPKPIHICLGVPMTSKGTRMESVRDSPLWPNLFDSFMHSVDWRTNRYVFKFYLGFDKADEMYDTGDTWVEIRDIFKARAKYRLEEDLIEAALITTILDTQLQIKIMHFAHLQGAPTQVVSQLMLQAYGDGFDYFYQVNDDTIIETPNWAPALISELAGNPAIPNFGVTGPLDTNNDKIFTHSFVHRTHIEVFGHFFPPSFKNWWSDDWISTVYGKEHTFRPTNTKIKHNVGAQKLAGFTRYEVDNGAQFRIDAELRNGFIQIDSWLKKNSKPRLPLPNVCGYLPAARYLYKGMKHATYNEEKNNKNIEL